MAIAGFLQTEGFDKMLPEIIAKHGVSLHLREFRLVCLCLTDAAKGKLPTVFPNKENSDPESNKVFADFERMLWLMQIKKEFEACVPAADEFLSKYTDETFKLQSLAMYHVFYRAKEPLNPLLLKLETGLLIEEMPEFNLYDLVCKYTEGMEFH